MYLIFYISWIKNHFYAKMPHEMQFYVFIWIKMLFLIIFDQLFSYFPKNN